MWNSNSYFSYLDYLQIRRRIERRLSRSLWLFIHVAVFVLVPLVSYITSPWGWWYPGGQPIMHPPLVHNWIAVGMMVWSSLLGLHGLWTFFHSGAWGKRRNQVIEAEMRERLHNQDTYLVQDPRDLFRLHGLLEDDVRRRAGATVIPLTLFAVGNTVLWISQQGGLYSAGAWYLTQLLAPLLLLIILGNLWYVHRRERRLRDLLASGEALPEQKPKREMHWLAAEDELLEIVDDDHEKPKRLAR